MADILWLPHPDNLDHWLIGYHNEKLVATITLQSITCPAGWVVVLTPRIANMHGDIRIKLSDAEGLQADPKAAARQRLKKIAASFLE